MQAVRAVRPEAVIHCAAPGVAYGSTSLSEMLSVAELAQWLSEDGAQELNESFASDKMLPEHARRLFCDAYMCMYQSSDIMMYR